MYNYNFKENNESLISEKTNINIQIDQKQYVVNFVLTEEHLLIFLRYKSQQCIKFKTRPNDSSI